MTNIDDTIEQMVNSESAARGRVASLIETFEEQLLEAIEDLSYEFIDAPDEMLAPDDDPNYDIADEVQDRFFGRIMQEYFNLRK